MNTIGLQGQGAGKACPEPLPGGGCRIYLPWNLRSTPYNNFRLGSPFYPLSLDGTGLG